MHRLFLEHREIGRCAACGGVWLDFGRLETLHPGATSVEALDETTARRCARCALSMTRAALSDGTSIETCSTCRGVYFDGGELERLLGRKVPTVPRPVAAGFVCVKCGKRFPFSEGNAIAAGLACRACTPQSQTTDSEKRAANFDVTEPGAAAVKGVNARLVRSSVELVITLVELANLLSR
jgi:Zn-finger nucleic acid-binding protein